MADKNLKAMYRSMQDDPFPPNIEVSFVDGDSRQTLFYEKTTWTINGEAKGLRYGENPDQPAALYKLVNGNLALAEVQCIEAGRHLASDVELLQSGKHPGKINITDVDAALNILRYFTNTPAAVVVKHNNPCGVAKGNSLGEAYEKALMADRIAAFGGAVALNRQMDRETASAISESYCEVVVAPEFEPGSIDILAKRKTLRIMKIGRMDRLQEYQSTRVVEYKALIDGGLAVQWSYVPKARTEEDFPIAEAAYKGNKYCINRKPSQKEYDDMIFGWLVESGVTSNSVIYVKDGVTIAIGTGEQDRVGVAEIAKFKAYRNSSDRICWKNHGIAWLECRDQDIKSEVDAQVKETRGGLKNSIMISDAFFPMPDGVEVGLQEGATGIVQPGGSLRDHEVIQSCNDYGATMVFTGQRSFRH